MRVLSVRYCSCYSKFLLEYEDDDTRDIQGQSSMILLGRSYEATFERWIAT